LATVIFGEVVNGQVTDAELVTPAELHESTAVATTVVLIEQLSLGAWKAAVKFAVAPGASEASVKTTGFGVTWASVT
jgi:hypothetical protein